MDQAHMRNAKGESVAWMASSRPCLKQTCYLVLRLARHLLDSSGPFHLSQHSRDYGRIASCSINCIRRPKWKIEPSAQAQQEQQHNTNITIQTSRNSSPRSHTWYQVPGRSYQVCTQHKAIYCMGGTDILTSRTHTTAYRSNSNKRPLGRCDYASLRKQPGAWPRHFLEKCFGSFRLPGRYKK